MDREPLGSVFEMADRIAFRPSAAEPFATMAMRVCESMSPFAFTSPAATLVPPISTPTNRLSATLRGTPGMPVTLAVGFGSTYGVEKNVQIAKRGEYERVVNALSPTGFALDHGRIVGVIDGIANSAYNPGNDGATHNGHVENARSVPGQGPEFRNAAGENAGEHDGIKETN